MSVDFNRFSLFKRHNGLYSILYYHHGRRRWKATNTTTKPEALAVLANFQNLLDAATVEPVPLQEFVTRFLSFAASTYSANSVELYRRVLHRFVQLVGNVYLLELTAEHFDRYKAQRLKDTYQGERLQPKSTKRRLKSVSPVSVNIELRALRAAMNTARRWKLVHSNPFQEVTFADVPEQTPAFFTAADFQALLNSIREGWLREVVLFAVLTGLREGEILHLRWCDVDLSGRLVTIQTSATFKTKAGRRRIVPLGEMALRVLLSRQGKSASEYVFTLNDKPIKRTWLQHLFKRRIREAGLPAGLHFHSTRHTFGSWLVQGGATLYEVQKLLGHSSSKVTEIYSHLQPEHLHGTVERLELNLN